MSEGQKVLVTKAPRVSLGGGSINGMVGVITRSFSKGYYLISFPRDRQHVLHESEFELVKREEAVSA